jgi:hypothetical protein
MGFFLVIVNLMVSQIVLICHPELVSGSRKSLILLDAESSSALHSICFSTFYEFINLVTGDSLDFEIYVLELNRIYEAAGQDTEGKWRGIAGQR